MSLCGVCLPEGGRAANVKGNWVTLLEMASPRAVRVRPFPRRLPLPFLSKCSPRITEPSSSHLHHGVDLTWSSPKHGGGECELGAQTPHPSTSLLNVFPRQRPPRLARPGPGSREASEQRSHGTRVWRGAWWEHQIHDPSCWFWSKCQEMVSCKIHHKRSY